MQLFIVHDLPVRPQCETLRYVWLRIPVLRSDWLWNGLWHEKSGIIVIVLQRLRRSSLGVGWRWHHNESPFRVQLPPFYCSAHLTHLRNVVDRWVGKFVLCPRQWRITATILLATWPGNPYARTHEKNGREWMNEFEVFLAPFRCNFVWE